GRMGANMSERLLRGGHMVVGFDQNPAAVQIVAKLGAKGAGSIAELVKQLAAPRAVWLMVPAGDPVDQTIEALLPLLQQGDILVDGGNSNYKDTIRRARMLAEKGLYLVDSGTSGGIWGLAEGYSLMVG